MRSTASAVLCSPAARRYWSIKRPPSNRNAIISCFFFKNCYCYYRSCFCFCCCNNIVVIEADMKVVWLLFHSYLKNSADENCEESLQFKFCVHLFYWTLTTSVSDKDATISETTRCLSINKFKLVCRLSLLITQIRLKSIFKMLTLDLDSNLDIWLVKSPTTHVTRQATILDMTVKYASQVELKTSTVLFSVIYFIISYWQK